MEKELSGRIAVVTGAGRRRGIGTAICRALADKGADIFFVWHPHDRRMRDEGDDPAELEAELRSKGLDSAVIREAMARYGDDHDELEAALALVRRRLSRMRGEADGEARERWRRRLVAMLCRRGFLVEVAERAVRQAMDGLNQEAGDAAR
ncbi:MAG: RecX family transcriptional regulator [Planifilum fulgidum]